MQLGTNNDFEVRALTLKKWGIPQTGSLMGIDLNEVRKYGKFASFQSHHFVDISSCCSNEIQAVYNKIQEIRLYQHSGKTPGAHIVQTIALIGRKTDFWDEPIPFVYVTFIQLASFSGWSYKDISDRIESIMEKYAGRDNSSLWSLYCSYDFCDLVLFTKGINIERYNKVLWEIALVRGGNLSLVRDTFTIYGFDSHFLIDSFQRLEKGDPIEWAESMALSVNLSIYSLADWENFRKRLAEKKITYQEAHISGRYDVCIITDTLSGEQIVWLLKCIDEIYKSQNNDLPCGFGGYEITPFWPAEEKEAINNIPPKDTNFIKYSNELLEIICKYEHGVADTYVKETARSLKELIQNGFSLEFVLAVLPSFSAVAKNFRIDKREQDDFSLKERNEYERAVQEYFGALNILTLCTMHGERRFIQAPAFSATYFDIPPKLMGFYAAISFYISKSLNSLYKNPPFDNYQFLLTPDYRSGINVVPICQERANEWVMIIYLAEKYFYDPFKAIYLLCHEMAHYLGERFREKRREGIFYALSLHTLLYTQLGRMIPSQDQNYLDNTISGKTLLGILAEGYASFLDEHFREHYQRLDRDMFVNVKDYLEFYDFGLAFFKEFDWRGNIIAKLTDKLANAKDQSVCQEITDALSAIQGYFRLSPSDNDIDGKSPFVQDSSASRYLTDMYASGVAGKKYACETLASYVAYNLYDIFEMYDDEEFLPFFKFSESTMSAYREAYADIRMRELLGDQFDANIYEGLLKEVTFEDADFEYYIRHDAVLYAMGYTNESIMLCKPPKSSDDDWVSYSDYYLSVRTLEKYLRNCHDEPAKSSEITEVAKIFSAGDLFEQYKLVLRTIACYKNEMVLYCKNQLL